MYDKRQEKKLAETRERPKHNFLRDPHRLHGGRSTFSYRKKEDQQARKVS